MSWRQWSIPVLGFAAVLSVVGQSSPVTTCISTYDWSINSLQQTPCLVAAYLESACGNSTIIPALPAGNHYLAPIATEADPCRCSSVTYSMISACAGCQNRAYIDWLTWSQDCPAVSLTTFPRLFPSAVVVPSWAYLNLSLTNNNFSLAAAQQNASDTPTISSAITSTSTRVSNSLTSAASASTSSTSAAGGSGSNAGAIAGGVVGGLGFVAIAGLGALWFCLRRKRNMVQRNVAFDSRALVSGTAMSQNTGSTQGVSPFLSQPSQSIYTSDMSLYPGSPLTTTGALTTIPPSRRSGESLSLSVAQFGGGPQNDNAPQTHGNAPQTYGLVPRGYTGMPEI